MRAWLLTVLVLPAAAAARGQELPFANREYGIGVVTYASLASGLGARDVIRAAPNRRAAVVARLAGDSLCFERPRSCSGLAERMIEYDYEVPGWAVLRYAPDSAWVEVSLGAAQRNAPTGWVQLRRDSVAVMRWDTALTGHSLFFLHPDQVAFFRQPDGRSRVSRALAPSPGTDRYDYHMTPLEARGSWLRVALESPSFSCEAPPPQPPRQDTLWIQYLTPARRPRVFYHTRGC